MHTQTQMPAAQQQIGTVAPRTVPLFWRDRLNAANARIIELESERDSLTNRYAAGVRAGLVFWRTLFSSSSLSAYGKTKPEVVMQSLRLMAATPATNTVVNFRVPASEILALLEAIERANLGHVEW